MILVVSKPAQAIIETLDRDTARQVVDFFAMLRSAQDQQELEKLFPGCINRLGGDFHWFAQLTEQCKIVMAFDHDEHKESIALVLNILDSRPLKPTGLKGYLVKASRWASDSLQHVIGNQDHSSEPVKCIRIHESARLGGHGFRESAVTRTAKVNSRPQRESSPACIRPEPVGEAAEVGETEESTSKNLTDMLRRAADEQRVAAREFQSRHNLQRNPLGEFFGRKNIEPLPENLNDLPLSVAERIARDFGNLG